MAYKESGRRSHFNRTYEEIADAKFIQRHREMDDWFANAVRRSNNPEQRKY